MCVWVHVTFMKGVGSVFMAACVLTGYLLKFCSIGGAAALHASLSLATSHSICPPYFT